MEQKKGNNNKVEEEGDMGVIVHSQVRKIRQEMEKIKHPSLQQTEMRPAVREITGKQQQQRSRSPLGLAQRPISVGS
ncbi:uncharacterized protein [Nicotiana sylvestris]|uniref:Uncharacterized protein n=2 Tax=Nicotiana TaxID=4085 RepID=A0A1S4CWS7_TOBAC|nr:PREDICTED: uncharacterized protein LOC104243790 [Nicotiana sylvestris]XP_016505605.1 PREDICTED: uncharacterized protein LOC107823478 [Nicotiana tabacum]